MTLSVNRACGFYSKRRNGRHRAELVRPEHHHPMTGFIDFSKMIRRRLRRKAGRIRPPRGAVSVIVYANRTRRVSTHLSEDNWRDALIRFGEVEAALADQLCPEHDEPHPLLACLRSIAIRLAAGNLEALQHLPPLPPEISVSVPEGYAYYGVYPEDYAQAALRFFREVRPQKIVAIGIRSIGTSLSAVVAATLQRRGSVVESLTVRPRGHPFDRHLSLRGFDFDRRAHFLVIDEGPGLSGSSFACVAGFLSDIGVPDERIILFPSWETDGCHFVSAAARRQWSRHRKYTEARPPLPGFRNLSAGRWRQFSPTAPAVQPQHERRKYLRGTQFLKFEGLADYGRAKFARARALAEGGFIPRPFFLDDGYLASEWVPGRPLTGAETGLAEWIRRYLQFLAKRFASDQAVPYDRNFEMIHVNIREGLGGRWAARAERLTRLRTELCDRGTVEIDGRMLPHEFLRTANGFVKADTLDHHDDHFFPGCQDVAWDVAAAVLEFGLTELEDLVPPACLTFYKIAYLSYRLGYCVMAAASGPDACAFCKWADHYRHILRYELNRLC